MRFRTPEWKARIAALAGFTLLLQAVLSSLTPSVAFSADAIESLVAHALCFGSGARRSDRDGPAPLPDRTHQGCCILCMVPALDASAQAPELNAPAWAASVTAPLRALDSNDRARLSERSPIRARAPPAA